MRIGLLWLIPVDIIVLVSELIVRSDIFYLIQTAMPTKHDRPTNVSVKRSSAGLGLFAAVPMKKKEIIIEYIGNRIASKDGDELENNSYVFTVNSRVDIDGSPRWNTARYANHSCRPNCESVIRKARVFIVARKNIQPGEELTYDYGKEFFNYFIKPFGCQCVKCGAKKDPKKVTKKKTQSRVE